MRIAILAHNLIHAGGASVGKNIVSWIPVLRPQNEYLILVPKDKGYPDFQDMPNVKVVEIPRFGLAGRLYFEQFSLPKIVKDFFPDFIWGLGNLGLVNPPCRQGILIHQAFLVYPSSHFGQTPLKERIKLCYLLKNKVSRCLKNTDIVFCQTPVMQERLSRAFKFPLDKIYILPNAVSEFSKINADEVTVPQVCKNSQTFDLFFLSLFYGHKNPTVLIDLFRQYSQELQDVRCIVTVAPNKFPEADRFLAKVERYGLQHKIVNVGALTQKELAGYFLHTKALFLHTLMESFSGTYLEAMHFGLPILTSDLDFARFICGDAALYFNPWSLEDIKNKILLMKKSTSIQRQLIDKGKSRLPQFGGDWQHITENALKVIENK